VLVGITHTFHPSFNKNGQLVCQWLLCPQKLHDSNRPLFSHSCEKSLRIQAIQPYVHKTLLTSKIVSFVINMFS
jgi:hypothetical protein